MPKPIALPDGSVIPQFTPSVSNALNKMIAFYGPSMTGKSLAMRSFLKMIQPHISFAMVISPTEPSNRSYHGIISPPFIHYEMNDKTMRILETLWKRQETLVSLFNLAHDPEQLHAIYKHCRSDDSDEKLQRVIERRTSLLKILPKDNHKHRERRERLKQETDKLLVKIYRRQIDGARDQLKGAPLSTEQWAIVNNLHINPNMVLILDDCAAELKKYMKEDIMRKLAYQGRHNRITTYIAAQDDTDIDAAFRRNAHLSLFTTSGTFSMYIKRQTSGVDPNTRKYGEAVSREVFGRAEPGKEFEFVRLIYERTPADGNPFKYLNEDPPSKFRLGAAAVWEYANSIAIPDHSVDTNNPFYEVIIGKSG